MRSRKLPILLLIFVAAVAGTIWLCNRAVERAAAGKLYTDVTAIPYRKAGLLLGTSKYLSGGYTNYYYSYRIQAATALVKAGKVKYLIISGDNSTKDYDEPTQMRADLMAAGVDSSIIFRDYAGFRTFDSMVRLREIFRQRSVTVISQPFHNKRALYIASREGIDAIGYNARDVDTRAGLKVQLREKLARVKVFVDYLLHQQPKFLGEPVPLPD